MAQKRRLQSRMAFLQRQAGDLFGSKEVGES